MAFQEITSPPMLDGTGQDIVSVLRQIYSKYDVEKSTLREVPFGVGVNDWVASDDVYVATVSSAYVTTTSKEFTTFTKTLRTSAKGDISVDKIHGGGGITLTTNVLPTGTINGTLYVIDADDGKVPILIEDTVVPVSNGGTGESTVAGAQDVLGITALEAADRKLQEGIAIIVDGDTASVAVPVGRYAYLKNNTHGLSDGLYKNNSSSAFPVSGGTADSTVFTSVPTGAVNDAVVRYGVERVELTTSLTIDANTEQEISLTILNNKVRCYNFISAMICDNGGSFDNVDFLKIVGIKNVWNGVRLCVKNTDIGSHTYNNLNILAYVHVI